MKQDLRSSLSDGEFAAIIASDAGKMGRRELAKALGISYTHVGDIIAGRRKVPKKVAAQYGYVQGWVRL